MKKLSFIFSVTLLLLSCSGNNDIKNIEIENTKSISLKIEVEKNKFELDEFYINDLNIEIDSLEPDFVITFFNNYQNVIKYDNSEKRDSLFLHLKNPNRQNIYKALNNYSMFNYRIKPFLLKKKLNVITKKNIEQTFQKDEILALEKGFYKNDGLILFSKRKKPLKLFFNKNNELIESIIKCYYNI